ncbi:hypothetical protein WICMUC_000774 [Wickerhamomyces mucosus]|uniref:DNA helicase n=1 Tax=Wickerhamomyces mucosus TaxID=1378264 RepID=A0A9P8PWM4_9ASCO|nr:hypothetical protein WICMUC_000774 [Wickerhamomyces mucosus]
MAEKELTHIITDVGIHMSNHSHNETTTDLEYGLRYVKDLVSTKILRKRKTDYVSLMTVDDLFNESNTGQDYVSLLFSFKQPFYNDLKEFNLSPMDKEVNGDGIIRALLYSIDIINQFVAKKKIKRNIVLITNSLNKTELNDEDFKQAIVDNVLKYDIGITLIGVDFDKPQFQETVNQWNDLFKRLPGSRILTGDEANKLIENPTPKSIRPVAIFRGEFRIGSDLLNTNFNSRYDQSCLSIEVEGYKAVSIAKADLTFKKYGVIDDEIYPTETSTDYTIRNYSHQSKGDEGSENDYDDEEDDDSPLEYETEVIDKSQIIKSFKYGKNSIVLPPELEKLTKLENKPGIDIRGIIDSSNLPKCYLTSESIFIVGKKTTKDIKALYAIIDSLFELNAFAIARYVQRENSDIQMVVLIPTLIKSQDIKRKLDIDEDQKALILIRLPYNEDIKFSVFPNIKILKTARGQLVQDSKLIPNDELQIKMDELVSKMTVDTKENDYIDNKRLFGINGINSIGIQRYNQIIKDIAIDSIKSSEGLLKYSQICKIPDIPNSIRDKITHDSKFDKDIDELSKLINAKKVEKLPRRRAQANEVEENFEEFSLDELLNKYND